ncbi:MAG: carbon storage regulator [Pirellulales bacterium]
MLVLSRKLMESIHVGNSIVVTVVKIRGNNVLLGIDAPKRMPVLRSGLKSKLPELPHDSV